MLRSALLLLVTLLLVPAGQAQPLQAYRADAQAMGTTVAFTVYAPSAEQAQALFTEALTIIEAVEQTLSTYRSTSLVSRLNAEAGAAQVTVDPAFAAFLQRSLAYSRQTDGAFDVTVGRLVEAWGFFRGEGRYPAADALAEARQQTGWRHVVLDTEARTVHFERPGLRLDFGGNGKGYALDRVQQRWRTQGVTAALLVFGGSSIYAIGAPPDADGWRVDLPVVPGTAPTQVMLRDEGLATSGGAHRSFELDGRRYSHLLDPRTGQPVQGRVQVTASAPTAEAADVLSTALFVLGPRDAEALLRATEATALFVEGTPERPRTQAVRWRVLAPNALDF
ncbi:MAG: FAD:protein FMN transferase [Bacteroidota bacterium]